MRFIKPKKKMQNEKKNKKQLTIREQKKKT